MCKQTFKVAVSEYDDHFLIPKLRVNKINESLTFYEWNLSVDGKYEL